MPDASRHAYRIDLAYRLCRPGGFRTPTTQSKTWFFEVPAARTTQDAWTELLQRIFYDANVALKRREPGDDSWLGLDTFQVTAVDPKSILAWDGKTAEVFPWLASEQRIVWEPGACYVVDDAGRYDTAGAHDFSELLMNRLLQAGAADSKTFVEFFNRYFPNGLPGAGQRMMDEREKRLSNILTIRELSGAFRKKPGGKPWVSGPVDVPVAS